MMLDYLVPAVLGLATQQIGSSIREVPTRKFLLLYISSNAFLFLKLIPQLAGATALVGRLLLANAIYWVVLIVATSIRRLFFHPLCRFPGERLAPLTQLYETQFWSQGRNGWHLKDLHEKYGDFVRTGPNEISICNVEAIKPLFTRSNEVQRGPYYEIGRTSGEYNLITQRDTKIHTVWRRIWEPAFRGEALLDYNVRVEAHVEKMVEVVQNAQGKEIDAWKVMGNMGFDIMADLCFAKDAGMQDGTGDPTYKNYLHDYMQMTAVLGCLRNVLDILEYLPKDKQSKNFIKNGNEMFEGRLKMGSSRKDIFSHLLGKDEKTGCKFTKKELLANSTLLVVAGGDSIGSVLTHILRELAKNPSIQQKLYDELVNVCGLKEEKDINIESVRDSLYLQAVIDESLRFWIGLPSGVQHTVIGDKGMELAGTFVPPGTVVRVPFLAIHRDERYYVEADKWIPERWTDEKPGYVKDRRAFIPFSLGAHVCIGKQLALNELRLSIARLVFKFQLVLGPTYDEASYMENWKDYFAIQPGKLHMRFLERSAT